MTVHADIMGALYAKQYISLPKALGAPALTG